MKLTMGMKLIISSVLNIIMVLILGFSTYSLSENVIDRYDSIVKNNIPSLVIFIDLSTELS